MTRSTIESAIRANRRSILAMSTSALVATMDGAGLARVRSEMGITFWSCESRNGVWVSTLVSEFGRERIVSVGEGRTPEMAERDAWWFMARAYAQRVELRRVDLGNWESNRTESADRRHV